MALDDPKVIGSIYPVGTRIEMVHCNDSRAPIETGTLGTVEMIDSVGTIHVRWDNGRSLGVVLSEDKIRKVAP